MKSFELIVKSELIILKKNSYKNFIKNDIYLELNFFNLRINKIRIKLIFEKLKEWIINER